MVSKFGRVIATTGALLVGMQMAGSALAQDKLKVAAGQRGNWDSAVPEIMQRSGIAKKHLRMANLSLIYLLN